MIFLFYVLSFFKKGDTIEGDIIHGGIWKYDMHTNLANMSTTHFLLCIYSTTLYWYSKV